MLNQYVAVDEDIVKVLKMILLNIEIYQYSE